MAKLLISDVRLCCPDYLPYLTFYFLTTWTSTCVQISPSKSEPLSNSHFLLSETLIFDLLVPVMYQHVLPPCLFPIHFCPSPSPACHLQVQLFSPVETLASQRALGGGFGSISQTRFGWYKLMPSLTTTFSKLFWIFYSAFRDYTGVFSGCVSHLVSPAQSSVQKVAVLGFGEQQEEEKVFVALPEKGMFVSVIYFFQAVTVTNSAIWLVLSAVRIFLSLTTVTVMLAWVFARE